MGNRRSRPGARGARSRIAPGSVFAWIAVGAMLGACAGEDLERDAGPADVMRDGDDTDAEPTVVEIAEPDPVVMTPCPEGWSTTLAGQVETCEPFPDGKAGDCPPGEVQFAGESGCVVVGDPCPSGDFPPRSDLPMDRPVFYVRLGDRAGDGSRERPFHNLAAAAAGSTPGSVLVLAAGEYRETATLKDGMELRGACTRDTRLASRELWSVNMESGAEAGLIRNLTLGPGAGFGLQSAVGSTVRLEGVIVTGTGGLTVGGRLIGRDVAFRSTLGTPLSTRWAEEVELSRVVIERSGPLLVDENVRVVMDQAVIRRSVDFPLFTFTPSRLELRATVFDDNNCYGAAFDGVDTEVVLRDVLVRGTQTCGEAPDDAGRGIHLQAGAHLDAARLHIEDAREAGLSLTLAATAQVEDLVVRGTRSRLTDRFAGFGLVVQGGSEATVRRAYLEANRDASVSVTGSRLRAEDLVVVDSRPREGDLRSGRAWSIQERGIVDLARARLERQHEVGMVVTRRSLLFAKDLRVLDTLPAACSSTTCPRTAFGVGLASAAGSLLRAERFELRRGHLCGLHMGDAQAELRHGIVAGFRLGVCMEQADYDLTRLEYDVQYVDNEASLRTVSLPAPEPTPLLASITGG